MRIRRGCGCPIMILGLFNLLMVIASIVSLFTHGGSTSVGTKGASTLGSVLFLTVFLGNLVVCVLIGTAALRDTSGRLESGGLSSQGNLADEGEETPDDEMTGNDSSSDHED